MNEWKADELKVTNLYEDGFENKASLVVINALTAK